MYTHKVASLLRPVANMALVLFFVLQLSSRKSILSLLSICIRMRRCKSFVADVIAQLVRVEG